MANLLEGLNPAQLAAVTQYQTPSLIIAGAGSGKTRVLTARIAYMLEQGVDPRSIIALTFTNKAAAQMKERLAEMVDPYAARAITMGTFHSIFSRIIRENAEVLGYPTSYTIYQPSDAKSLIKSIVKEMDLDAERYKPASIISRISFAKNSLITPAAYLANTNYIAEDRQLKIPEFAKLYSTYCARCKAAGALDFDDLLLQANILFRDFPDVLRRYQQRYQYILVDEYQDTNYAQYIIIRRLSQLHGRVCVVGDDAQSIYSFRGAKIENILNFRTHYPTAQIFKLEQNYRSTQNIVDAANSIIAHNRSRLDKRCFSAGNRGEKIRIMRATTDGEEAILVVNSIMERIKNEGVTYDKFAILYRTNSQSQSLEQALRRRGVPYQIYRGNSFYEQKEIKDILAYIRLIINPRDDEAFRRIINYPVRGIGGTTVDRIGQIAAQRGVSMWDAIDTLVSGEGEDAQQRTIIRKVKEFVEMIRELSLERCRMGLYDFGMLICTRSGILSAYRLQATPEATSAVENIEELLNTMQIFSEQVEAEVVSGERLEDEVATVEEWLQSVMLLTDQDSEGEQDEQDGRVTLMTVHSSKGLEYEYIYIVGVEQNLFPSQRAMESGEIEEERRLFYVAITRAKCAAAISYCDSRFKWGKVESCRPSLFLRDIDPQYIEVDSETEINKVGSNYTRSGIVSSGGYQRNESAGSAGRFGSNGSIRSAVASILIIWI
ncbi:MAG: UvrD-helicase domain-containing protein, partial [Rikenellaceae bacterium]